jgi:hypothetical protein
LEANAHYLALTDHIFSGLERPDSKAVTSTITMTELLAQPYRDADEQRVNEFFGLLSTFPNLDWIAFYKCDQDAPASRPSQIAGNPRILAALLW